MPELSAGIFSELTQIRRSSLKGVPPSVSTSRMVRSRRFRDVGHESTTPATEIVS